MDLPYTDKAEPINSFLFSFEGLVRCLKCANKTSIWIKKLVTSPHLLGCGEVSDISFGLWMWCPAQTSCGFCQSSRFLLDVGQVPVMCFEPFWEQKRAKVTHQIWFYNKKKCKRAGITGNTLLWITFACSVLMSQNIT